MSLFKLGQTPEAAPPKWDPDSLKILIYQSELERIRQWTSEYPDLETGGEPSSHQAAAGFFPRPHVSGSAGKMLQKQRSETMSTKNPNAVGQSLAEIRTGNNDLELFMNQTTGELEVRTLGESGGRVDKDALPGQERSKLAALFNSGFLFREIHRMAG